jgi:hypothetical protein
MEASTRAGELSNAALAQIEGKIFESADRLRMLKSQAIPDVDAITRETEHLRNLRSMRDDELRLRAHTDQIWGSLDPENHLNLLRRSEAEAEERRAMKAKYTPSDPMSNPQRKPIHSEAEAEARKKRNREQTEAVRALSHVPVGRAYIQLEATINELNEYKEKYFRADEQNKILKEKHEQLDKAFKELSELYSQTLTRVLALEYERGNKLVPIAFQKQST